MTALLADDGSVGHEGVLVPRMPSSPHQFPRSILPMQQGILVGSQILGP